MQVYKTPLLKKNCKEKPRMYFLSLNGELPHRNSQIHNFLVLKDIIEM